MPEKCTEACPDLTRLEQQLKDLQKQNGADHKEIRDRLTILEKEEAVQAVQYRTILDKLDGLTEKVENLESKPGKRWESIVEKAIWAVCAAVIAFLLARIGL
jgi:predicted nuclease with TOPRIM domain